MRCKTEPDRPKLLGKRIHGESKDEVSFRGRDIPHAEKLLKQCQRTRKSNVFVMDKGYDSEDIHRMIRDDLQSFSLISVKTRKRKRIMGHYRRELAKSFDEHLYHRRNLVETVFSVLKRKFGECLKSRKYRNQVKEIKIKIILYNIGKIP